jgi:hypothetical protein
METKKLKIMNYELSENEKKSLNDGSIVSVACYNAKDAAMGPAGSKYLFFFYSYTC